MPIPPSKSDPIAIIGAGIFGLSTALHLARRGYTSVAVYDKQPYEEILYSYLNGCDAASADINKIIRSAYGTQTVYQDLMTSALQEWRNWNAEIRSGQDLPSGFTSKDEVFVNCGSLSCNDGDTIPPFEQATIDNMKAKGHIDTQLVNNDSSHLMIAKEKGFTEAMNPFAKKALGVLDTTGGFAVADKACRYALHKAKSLGVRFILGHEGHLKDIHYSDNKVTGLETIDGKYHPAKTVILACGGWTPSLLPSMDGLCETTAGSVIILKIPDGHPLRERFHHSRFPSYMYKFRDGAEGGIYGFPVDENGYLKIGYRGIKYTNPQRQPDGQERSVPVTRWTPDSQMTEIPEQAYIIFRRFLDEFMPELGQAGIDIWMSRVCWYTDSYDNHFVIDHVPEKEGLMVATGGSGHGFKFLPNLGEWVVDILEGKGLDRELVKAWRWRERRGEDKVVNELMEGRKGERALGNVRLVKAEGTRSKL